MNISYNWLNEYLALQGHTPQRVGEILTDIGLEVEHIETYEPIPGGLAGLVVGEVLSCQKHPDADRLRVTTVDVGLAAPLQIVCGAPNVAVGQKVIVATIGTKLYPTSGEPFVIKASKIRGVESQGMICAEDEIGIGQSHDGILVLPAHTAVGLPAAEYFGLRTDYILDVNLTPNRSDATSHLGVAKDLAAALSVHTNTPYNVQYPPLANIAVGDTCPVKIAVHDTQGCTRYSGLVISGIQVAPSPEWLKTKLQSIGVRPINNIVDVTNYILWEYGQPLHAFDLQQIQHNTILVQNLPEGTPFTTLDEQERKLSAHDVMICDGNSTPLCMAGVFGGLHSGINEHTTSIFLESAIFQAQAVRRTATRHQLRTDAAKIFEKGGDVNKTIVALQRAAYLITQIAGGTPSVINDCYPNPVLPAIIHTTFSYINQSIGDNLAPQKILHILQSVGFDILHTEGDSLKLQAPTDKTDVLRPADVVEEVLRIYGLNAVPIPTRIHAAISYAPTPDPYKLRNTAADFLAQNGLLEMMALSITRSKYCKEVLEHSDETLVYINNTSNKGLDVMRPNMLFGVLEAVAHNINRQITDVRLFEMGKTYHKTAENYREVAHLAIAITGRATPEHWAAGTLAKSNASFFDIKAITQQTLAKLGVHTYQETEFHNEIWQYGIKLHRGEQVIAHLGLVHPKVAKKMDIKAPVFYADIQWDTVFAILKKHKITFTELPKFPSVRRDLALIVDKNITYQQIADIVRKEAKKLLKDINLFDVYEHAEKLGANKKSYALSFTLQLPDRTLQDAEINTVMERIVATCQQQLGAHINK
jgi:phenylalanyl-tRNA synthetase beta chain